MSLLAIESSCDETAAAVMDLNGKLLTSKLYSQTKLHQPFAGVVPEVASRAHCATLLPLIEDALDSAGVTYDDLKAVAVTAGPGLLGSLLVGTVTAKALAFALKLPVIAVDHLEAHIAAAFINGAEPRFPLLALVVSGGHTILFLVREWGKLEVIGTTLDDAVGEAYDKIAVRFGLGYPGGPIIDTLAREYTGEFIDLPKPMATSKSLNFSFSGLKTAVIYAAQAMGENLTDEETKRLVVSFQDAAIKTLLIKLKQAVERHAEVEQIVISGGVACNSELRQQLANAEWLANRPLLLPEAKYCTDNAAMCAFLGLQHFHAKRFAAKDFSTYATFTDSPVISLESCSPA